MNSMYRNVLTYSTTISNRFWGGNPFGFIEIELKFACFRVRTANYGSPLMIAYKQQSLKDCALIEYFIFKLGHLLNLQWVNIDMDNYCAKLPLFPIIYADRICSVECVSITIMIIMIILSTQLSRSILPIRSEPAPIIWLTDNANNREVLNIFSCNYINCQRRVILADAVDPPSRTPTLGVPALVHEDASTTDQRAFLMTSLLLLRWAAYYCKRSSEKSSKLPTDQIIVNVH